MPRSIELLIVVAMPIDRPPTHAALEVRIIKQIIARNRLVRVRVCESSTIDLLRWELLVRPCTMLHIIAHGTEDALIFERESGRQQAIDHDELNRLLLAHRPPLRDVIIGACHSAGLVRQLAEGGLRAVGLRGPAHAAAAIEFSRGVYDALVAKRAFEFAVEEGRRACALHGHSLAVEFIDGHARGSSAPAHAQG